MRFRLVWAMATTLPRIILRAARIHHSISQISALGNRAMTNTRARPARAAALTADDMNAVMDVGAPS